MADILPTSDVRIKKGDTAYVWYVGTTGDTVNIVVYSTSATPVSSTAMTEKGSTGFFYYKAVTTGLSDNTTYLFNINNTTQASNHYGTIDMRGLGATDSKRLEEVWYEIQGGATRERYQNGLRRP